jgi:hypothetical protein
MTFACCLICCSIRYFLVLSLTTSARASSSALEEAEEAIEISSGAAVERHVVGFLFIFRKLETLKEFSNSSSASAAAAAAFAICPPKDIWTRNVAPPSEHQTPRTEPKTADLQALLLDEESQITMENIVDDTLKLHSASDVRVLDALCLSVAIVTDEYVYTLFSYLSL